MKLLLTLIIILVLIKAIGFSIYISKRLKAHLRLKSLSKKGKVKLKFTRNFIKSLFKISHAPDVIAEIGDKIYLMRYYNGKGGRYHVHFANEEYSVRFQTLLIRSLFAAGGRLFSGHASEPQSTTSVRRKVICVPKLEIPEEYKNSKLYGKTIVPILIFNPTPSNLTYVTDEKTSIKLAFTGDSFRGIKIYTGSSVAAFLEREERFHRELSGKSI